MTDDGDTPDDRYPADDPIAREAAKRKSLRTTITFVEMMAFLIGICGVIGGVALAMQEREDGSGFRTDSEHPYVAEGIAIAASSVATAALMLLLTGYITWRILESEARRAMA